MYSHFSMLLLALAARDLWKRPSIRGREASKDGQGNYRQGG